MKLRFLRLVGLGVVLLALTACASPGPAAADQQAGAPVLGLDLGGSGPVVAPPQPPPRAQAALGGSTPSAGGEIRLAHDGHAQAQGTGAVNSVDAAARKINLNHGPIPAIGWPAMTMDFTVAPAVDLRAVKPGTQINFTIEKGAGGLYEIQAIIPAGGGR